jgi:phosphate transport system permease protein
VGAILAAALGALFAFSQIGPNLRARNRVEGWVVGLLFACSAVAVLTTVGIVTSLVWDALRFFDTVPVADFLFGTQWSPQIAIRADQVGSSGAFGALPLFAGTILIMLIAMAVAAPIGLFSAIYLSEYASPLARSVVKPLLEVLAGVPTVVYGFFAALTVGPTFRAGFNGLGAWLVGGPLDGLGQYLLLVQNQMALVAGAVMGIMLIPFVSSLSDDIINAVPQSLRDGSYAMGATKSETIKRVVMPAALPGVAGALLLAVSRAVGETMIVTMAAGLAARLTLNPLDTVTTVTVQIVTLLTGDQEFNSPKTLSAFGLGLTLFLVTLALNIAAQRIVKAYREQYD